MNLRTFLFYGFKMQLDIEPVSYTHLDVYKRQPMFIWTRNRRNWNNAGARITATQPAV